MERIPETKLLDGLKRMCPPRGEDYWFALNDYVFITPENHPSNAADDDEKIDDYILRKIRELSDTDYLRLEKLVG